MEKTNTCKNCGNVFTGNYCNKCGEKVYTDHDKHIPHFFEDAFHFITHFEGTFFNTLKAVFTRPGKLSLDYCNGLRKKYFKPLSFFMLLVILYLIFPFFTGLNMPFRYYLAPGSVHSRMVENKTGFDFDSLSRRMDTVMMSARFASENDANHFRLAYMDSAFRQSPELRKTELSFNKKSEKTSKILLLLLIPLTAVALWIYSLNKKRYFFDHLVLATEINAFYLLFSFFIVPFIVMLMNWIAPALSMKIFNEISIGLFSYGVIAIYATIAFHRFFKDPWWWALLKGLLLVVTHFYIVQLIYKFVLFATTLYLSE